jgi:repressor of nif and glnA expression
MEDKIEKKRLTILKILRSANRPVSSTEITRQLNTWGDDISERTVRFHLLAMDKEGLTAIIGRQGRKITAAGMKELAKARVHEKVGFLAAKIDQMTYLMDFNLKRCTGKVVVNVSFLEKKYLQEAIPLMSRVFKTGYAMGRLLTLFDTGEQVGETQIPAGNVGIGTICSITVNGVLLQHGIPTHSVFGGLLEISDYKPTRFVEMIRYDGTTLDPLEIFIKSGMTDYSNATASGNGLIGASFREVPAVSRDRVLEIASELEKIGLGSFMEIGWPGQALMGIPIPDGQIGAIVIGGLNPVAILEENKIEVFSKALSGLVDYKRLFHYDELEQRARKLM